MAYLYRRGAFHWDFLADRPQVKRSLAWSIAALVSLPMIVAAYRKASALGMLLAELSIPERIGGAYNMRIRAVLGRFIPLATMVVLGLLVAALASTILPTREVAVVLVLVLLLLAWLLWRGLVQVHARLQAALRDTLDKPGRSGDGHP
jgi:CPA2 family monovalent cation:H+ antiporter-2